MTTTPLIETVSSIARMASTAAWSAEFLSPRPIQRPQPSAAASVTRTSSRARFRSGVDPFPPVGTGGILLLRDRYGRVRRRRLSSLVEDHERASGEHREPADGHFPSDRLAEDRPREERRRDGLDVGEKTGCLRPNVPKRAHVQDAEDGREERAQDEHGRPLFCA